MARSVESLLRAAMRRRIPPTTTEILREAGPTLGKAETLRAGMGLGRRVAFDYTRKDGQTMHYVVAPYSVRRRGRVWLYATDHKHGDRQIHSFAMSRVQGAEIRPARTFRPAWDTEPDTV